MNKVKNILKHRASTSFCDKNFSKTLSCHLVIQARFLVNFKAPMGCRSFLPSWRNEQGENENNGRCNLGVVTLNLPRIALESQGDMSHRRFKIA
jgi:anaerobic ribonucleoside-triphosphate reductase